MFSYTPLIIIFPLLGFLVLGLFGSRMKNEKLIGMIGSGTVGLSFLLALLLFLQMLSIEPEQRKQIVTYSHGFQHSPDHQARSPSMLLIKLISFRF